MLVPRSKRLGLVLGGYGVDKHVAYINTYFVTYLL
jgi:hypothetical protein